MLLSKLTLINPREGGSQEIKRILWVATKAAKEFQEFGVSKEGLATSKWWHSWSSRWFSEVPSAQVQSQS